MSPPIWHENVDHGPNKREIDKCLAYLILHIILILILYKFDINLSKTTHFTLDYIIKCREIKKYEIWWICDVFGDKFKENKRITLSPKANAKHCKTIYWRFKCEPCN